MTSTRHVHCTERRKHDRRVLLASLAISAALHAIALGPWIGGPLATDDSGGGPVRSPPELPWGVRTYRIVVTGSDGPAEPSEAPTRKVEEVEITSPVLEAKRREEPA